MIIQKILFPQDDKIENEMFFRTVPYSDVEYIDIEKIRIKKGTILSTNTYFNSFSLNKWTKYTTINNLSLKLLLDGEAEVKVYGCRKQGADFEIREVYCEKKSVLGEESIYEYEIMLENDFVNIFFEIHATINDIIFNGGSFSTTSEPENEVRLGVDICTINRYEYLEKNVIRMKDKILSNKNSVLYNSLEVFIVDNGNDKTTCKLSDEKVHVFLQDGKGSTGGFTRGILEIEERKKFTHCILMDDDVYLYPEVLERLYGFLLFLKKEYDDALIGGALMRMDIPYIQHESGALWNDGNIIPCKHNADMRKIENVVENEIEERTEYMGWWFCCVPLVAVERRGYPLPVYFHRDDVEYGLRNPKQITLNGICTWHEPFESKIGIVNEYYDMRNMGILFAIYGGEHKKNLYIKHVIQRVFVSLLRYEYNRVELILQAFEDFAKGPEWVIAIDSGNYYNELRKKENIKSCFEDVIEPIDCDYRNDDQKESKIRKLLRYIMLNGVFLKAKKNIIVPAYEPNTSFFWRAKRVYFVNGYTGKYYLEQKNIKKLFMIIRRSLKDIVLIFLNFDRLVKQWAEKKELYIERTFWKRVLEN